MDIIKINSKCKQYKKEDKMMQRSLRKALERLMHNINVNGGDPNRIFNNDSIVYDRINDDMFIFKTRGANNSQLRIVYGFERTSSGSILYFIDYTNKKKNQKEYITVFNSKFQKTRLSNLAFQDFAPGI